MCAAYEAGHDAAQQPSPGQERLFWQQAGAAPLASGAPLSLAAARPALPAAGQKGKLDANLEVDAGMYMLIHEATMWSSCSSALWRQ